MTLTLDALNRMNPGDFTSAVGDTFELAPWVAEGAAARRRIAQLETELAVTRRAAELLKEQAPPFDGSRPSR